MKNGVSSKGSTLRITHLARIKPPPRPAIPDPAGNRRQRRAYAAQQKQQQDKRL